MIDGGITMWGTVVAALRDSPQYKMRNDEVMNKHKEFKTGAQKDVEGKLRMDLIPPEVESAYAEVLTFGCEKYEDRNWEKGIPYMSGVAALKRHLNAWQRGEDINEESGYNHMKHVLFWAAAICTFIERKRDDLDDRRYDFNE